MCNFSDFISVGNALKVNAPGREFRGASLTLQNGTNANTLKCTLVSRFNGDAISTTDNIAKNGTTGNFTLNAGGTWLIIEKAGLSGDVLYAFGRMYSNASGSTIMTALDAYSTDIRIMLKHLDSTALYNITYLVDSGDMYIDMFYITNA
jgi:hypothetical protein